MKEEPPKIVTARCDGCSRGRLTGQEWTWRNVGKGLLKTIKTQRNTRNEKCFKDIKIK